MTFGKNLQNLRKEKGLSQDTLANMLYVTRQSVSQWENDKTMPSVDLLIKLSEIFDTTVDALLGKPESESVSRPAAKVKICGNKSGIKSAMRYQFATLSVVLLSVGMLFAVVWLMYVILERNLFTPEVSSFIKSDFLNAWIFAVLAVLCLIAAAVPIAIGAVNTHRAVKFGTSHDCTLNFYYDYLVIEEKDAEPLSLFYANIRQIVETDGYFIIKMLNGAVMCVDKRGLDRPEELSKLLKSTKNYVDRCLCKAPADMGSVKRSLVRFFREFLFTATFFTVPVNAIIFGVLCTILTENQAVRLLVFAVPFVVLIVEVIVGIIFTLRKIKAKRMIIAGGAGLIIIIAQTLLIYNTAVIYDFQHDSVTSGQFVSYMEQHGFEVEDTIVGRQENFIFKCYTARPKDKAFEIQFFEFDRYSREYGLFSAREAYGNHLNKISSQPRLTTRYVMEDYAFNSFYTEITNNHYAYVSLNEYSVIYIDAPLETQAEVQDALKDFELKKPYIL